MHLGRCGANFLGDLKSFHCAQMSKLAEKFSIQYIPVSIVKASFLSDSKSAMGRSKVNDNL